MNRHLISAFLLIMAAAFYVHSGIAYFYLNQPWQFTSFVSLWILLLSIWVKTK